jgi:hypothetical protein
MSNTRLTSLGSVVNEKMKEPRIKRIQKIRIRVIRNNQFNPYYLKKR